MSYETLATVASFLFGSWLVLIVRYAQARREIRSVKAVLAVPDKSGLYATRAAQALQALSKTAISLEDYPDKDGDGVPDAFQRRKPLSQMLEFETSDNPQLGVDTVAKLISLRVKVEVDLPRRPPKAGEYYLDHRGHVQKNEYDFTHYDGIILHCAYGMNLDDLVDICDEWRKQRFPGEIDSPGHCTK